MKNKLKALIERLENYDFESELYLTYLGKLNDGDISDWYDTNFHDVIDRGAELGATALAEDIINELKAIIGE